VIENRGGDLSADHRFQLLTRRAPYVGQAVEPPQQLSTAVGTDAGDVVQLRSQIASGA
jgi:hypothetical protein